MTDFKWHGPGGCCCDESACCFTPGPGDWAVPPSSGWVIGQGTAESYGPTGPSDMIWSQQWRRPNPGGPRHICGVRFTLAGGFTQLWVGPGFGQIQDARNPAWVFDFNRNLVLQVRWTGSGNGRGIRLGGNPISYDLSQTTSVEIVGGEFKGGSTGTTHLYLDGTLVDCTLHETVFSTGEFWFANGPYGYRHNIAAYDTASQSPTTMYIRQDSISSGVPYAPGSGWVRLTGIEFCQSYYESVTPEECPPAPTYLWWDEEPVPHATGNQVVVTGSAGGGAGRNVLDGPHGRLAAHIIAGDHRGRLRIANQPGERDQYRYVCSATLDGHGGRVLEPDCLDGELPI